MKRKIIYFEEAHQQFLCDIGAKKARFCLYNWHNGLSYPNSLAFQQQILNSDSVEKYLKDKFKILGFNVSFENPQNISLSSESFFFYDADISVMKLYLKSEEDVTFDAEKYVVLDRAASVTSTATLNDLLDFVTENFQFRTDVQSMDYSLPFDMTIHQLQNENNILNFSILIPNERIYEEIHADLYDTNRNMANRLLTLFAFDLHKHFFFQTVNSQESVPLTTIYKAVYEKQLEKNLPLLTLEKPEKLKPDLKPYQISAVQWMMHRELNVEPKKHQILFQECQFPNGDKHFVHQAFGFIITQNAFENYQRNFPLSTGGILADEMGLGKTVETIALILQNPSKTKLFYPFAERDKLFDFGRNIRVSTLVCPCGKNQELLNLPIDSNEILESASTNGYFYHETEYHSIFIKCLHCGTYQHSACQQYSRQEGRFPYLCNRCWIKVDKIQSPATLIVCPKVLLEQWKNELQKHAPDLNVAIFRGTKSTGMMYPPQLASRDIVLTTYDVLSKEIDFMKQFDETRLRHSKRFVSTITPLLSIYWHRLCLDEAQMIGLSKAFQMAQSINSTYRWAITGTPMEKNATEMKNFFEFINEEPFRHHSLTKRILSLDSDSCDERKDFCYEAISNCLWRTPKAMVVDEIGLKQPIINIATMEMSQIERDFYQQTIGILKKTKSSTNFQKGNQGDIGLYLYQFSRLRKICCCPSVVGNSLTTARVETEPLSVEERMAKLFKSMINNAKKNAIGHLRAWVTSMNGTSALLIQNSQFTDAIFSYRKTLKFIKDVEEHFKVDSIQLYHIYYNYAKLLIFYESVQINEAGQVLNDNLEPLLINDQPPAKEDKTFEFEEGDQFCVLKAQNFFDKYFLETQGSLLEVHQELLSNKDPIRIAGQSQSLLQWYIPALCILERKDPTFFSVILPDILTAHVQNRLSNPTGLKNETKILLIKMKKAHEKILGLFEVFLAHDLQSEDFHQYYDCHISRILLEDELCPLCTITKKINKIYSKLGVGVYDFLDWRKANLFSMLIKLSSYWSNCGLELPDFHFIHEESVLFFDYIQALMSDFRIFRSLVSCYSDIVNRHDEIRQAKSLFTAESLEVCNIRMAEAIIEQDCCLEQFQHDSHHVKYLNNLLKNIDQQAIICCICLDRFEMFVILPCGHFNCKDCFHKLTQKRLEFLCCICRTRTHTSKVHFANNRTGYVQESVQTIVGQSTKFKHVCLRLQEIIRKKEKVLVFSSWTDMLQELQACLERNFIISRLITSTAKFGERLDLFRRSDGCNVLLLPFNLAARGLNLTEANHVLFIDTPVLLGDELQSIGRIHRIGQLRQTYVHKFVMANTIEEMIKNRSNNIEEPNKKESQEYILHLANAFLER